MKKKIAFILLGIIGCNFLFAHDIVMDLEKMSKTDTAFLYLQLGFEHILPMGLDHILFVLSLFLLSPGLKTIMWQTLAFTVAHSVTLGLSMYHILNPSPAVVEPLIALSILYVALENIFSPKLKGSRIAVVFLFGLVHGMGFAGALQKMGLPESAYLSSLIMFNIGVEFGQISIILAAYFLVGKWFGNKPNYRRIVVIPLSVIISLVAAYWTIERLF